MTSNQVTPTGQPAASGSATATVTSAGTGVDLTWTLNKTQTSASVKRRCVTDNETYASASAVAISGTTQLLADRGDKSWGYFTYGKTYEYEVTVTYS